MTPAQLERITSLHDKLLDVALLDADPANWVASGKKPNEMTKDERGDAKWCRSLAVQTVALTMQVRRLMENPLTGGATVPTEPERPPTDEAETVEAEIERYEQAAEAVLKRAAGKAKR